MGERSKDDGALKALPAKLTVVQGEDAGLVFALGETEAVIGRGVGVEVQVRGQGVSRRHARLTRNADGKLVLHDLGSANGTYVNDEKIEQRVLKTGDHLRIARDVVLDFSYELPDDRETLDLARPAIRRPVDGSLTATMVNIGRLHLSSGDFSRAVRSLGQALDKMRDYEETPPDELASVLADLAECHLGLGHSDRARDLAEESVSLSCRGSADTRISAQANFVLARSVVDLDVVRARELAIDARRQLEDREPLARRIDEWLA